MTKGTIVFVVGDAGAANEMLPVAPILSDPKRGWDVKWFCDPTGKAKTNWEKKGIPFETREPTPMDAPSLVLVGVSSKAAGLGNAWTAWAKASGVPVGWYSDLPGTDNRASMAAFSPDFLLVTSMIHREISRERRRKVAIYVVGKPTCVEDRARLADRKRLRAEFPSKFGVPRGAFLVTYLSGGESEIRAKEQLRAVADAVMRLGDLPGHPVYLEPRLNPVLKDEARFEMLEVLRSRPGLHLLQANMNTFDAVFTADVVIGDWGCTDITRSAACGIPTGIFLNYPDDRARLTEAFGESLQHPLLRCEAAAPINSSADCLDVLRTMFGALDEVGKTTWDNARPFRDLQEPGAAKKIADTLEQIISERTVAD